MTVACDTAGAGAKEAPRQWVGTLVVVFSASCFGMIGTMARFAYLGGSNPLTIALLRVSALVACAGLAIALLRRSVKLTPSAFRTTLLMGAATVAGAWGFLGSVAYIPVSLAALVMYTYPLLVGLLAAASGRESMTLRKAAILVCAFVGLTLALGPTFSALDWRGLALAGLASVCNALMTAFGGRALEGRDTLAMNFATNLWAALAIGAFLALSGGFALPATGMGGIGAAGAALLYVGAFLTWFIAMRLTSPVRMAVLYNLDAVINILAGVFILGEVLTAVQVAGIVLVLGCLVLTALHRAA
jgi:drug/metabolite transporter (DMT)-like permease